MSSWRIHTVVVAGFIGLVVVVFGPRIFVDRTLLIGDGTYYADLSFRRIAAEQFTTRPKNFLTHVDNALDGYPHLHYVQGTLSSGTIPWWNPYVALGMPEAGMAAAVFEPITALFGRLVPIALLPNVKVVVGLTLMGWGMFVFARALGVSTPAALLAAVTLAFSGWTLAWLGRTNYMAAIWMPWAFWAALRVLAASTVSRVAALALFSGLACLSSHPQTAFHILAALGTWMLIRLLAKPGPASAKARTLAALGVGIAGGLAIGLVQLVPSIDLVHHADLPPGGRARTRVGASLLQTLWFALAGDPGLLQAEGPTVVMALSPFFFGSPVDNSWWWPPRNAMELMLYAGLAPLFCALWALARERRWSGAGVWLAMVAVALGVALALPLLAGIAYLPGFNRVSNGRLRMVFTFALALAAAFGADRLAADVARRAPWVRRAPPLFAVAAASVLVVVYAGVGVAGVPRPPAADVVRAHLPFAILLAALTALVLAAWRGGLGTRGLLAGLLALTVLDLGWHFHDFNPAIDTRLVFPDTPLVRFLRADPEPARVSSGTFEGALFPNTKLPYRLFDTDVFSVLNVDRYTAVQQRVNAPMVLGADNTFRHFSFKDPERFHGLIDLMNVKYVVVPPLARRAGQPDRYADSPRWQVVYDQEVRVYQNLGVLPRAFLVDRVTVVDAPRALAAITAPTFEPRDGVLLEDPSAPALPPGDGTPPGRATVTRMEANRVLVQAQARRPAYLVLSELYYPGWEVEVDGRPAPLYVADYLFRAVHLAAGSHELVFAFRPRRYFVAGAVSAAAGLAVTIALVTSVVRRRLETGGDAG